MEIFEDGTATGAPGRRTRRRVPPGGGKTPGIRRSGRVGGNSATTSPGRTALVKGRRGAKLHQDDGSAPPPETRGSRGRENDDNRVGGGPGGTRGGRGRRPRGLPRGPRKKRAGTATAGGSQTAPSEDAAPVAARTRRSAGLPGASRGVDASPLPLRAGARVAVLFSAEDGWGDVREEWYRGTVESVRERRGGGRSKARGVYEGRVAFDDGTDLDIEYPGDDVRLLPPEEDESDERDNITAGSTVDGRFADNDEGLWYRATVASVREARPGGPALLGLVYHDGECESNVPPAAVRTVQVCDSDGWLVGKPALLRGGRGSRGKARRGRVVSVDGRGGATVEFDGDGSTATVDVGEARGAVFADRADAAAAHHVRPVAVPRRRRGRSRGGALAPTRASKRSKTAAGKSAATEGLVPGPRVRVEPVRREDYAPDLVRSGPVPSPTRPEVGGTVAARPIPATLPNLLMMALDGPEPETGLVHLLCLLQVHDALPPASSCRRLMEAVTRGPRERGGKARFGDVHRTDLACDYACALVGSSTRLVRTDGSAPFGPASWDDVSELLSRSTDGTDRLEPGVPTGRLAEALHLAARGAGLLSLMLRTELRGRAPPPPGGGAPPGPFGRDELASMPTVRGILSHGARDALRAASAGAAGCLARHRAFFSAGGAAPPQSSPHARTCRVQAAACLDGLASAVGLVAFVFCAREGVAPSDPGALFVIRDGISRVFEACLDERGLRGEEREKAGRELGRVFCAALSQERYAEPLVVPLARMLGLGSEDMPGFLFRMLPLTLIRHFGWL